MTLPHERRRAIEWAGETLREIRDASKDLELWGGPIPEKLRQAAVRILRHYPEPWQIEGATKAGGMPVSSWIGPEPDQMINERRELRWMLMYSYIDRIRDKQEDIARAVDARKGTLAATAAYEIGVRASHAQSVWQEARGAEKKGKDLLGELLDEVSNRAERIVQAHKASDPIALTRAGAAMEKLVARIELTWQAMSASQKEPRQS